LEVLEKNIVLIVISGQEYVINRVKQRNMSLLEKMLESTQDLLKASARDCAKELQNDKEILHSKMSAGYILLDTKEKVQVQVIVTRDEDSFLDDFQIENTSGYFG